MSTTPEMTPFEPLLEGFSRSVRSAMTALDFDEPTVWQIADILLRNHSDYGGSALLPLSRRDGAPRPRAQWLALIRALFDLDAVAGSRSEVIDGRLVLLALSRLDNNLDRLLRESGLRWRLERDLAFPINDVFLPWALPAPPTTFFELGIVRHQGEVNHCVFSPDGRFLATASDDETARLWELPSATERAILRGHEGTVLRCAFSPDSRLLATASLDRTARLWDVSSGTELATVRGHEDTVWRCVFSPDGRLLATASEDGTARLWNFPSGTERATLSSHTGPVFRCAFSSDGRLLATASRDETARLWELPSGSEHATLRGHEGPVLRCVFHPHDLLLATASDDGTARLWELASGTELATLGGHGGAVLCCAFSPDGRLLATASEDGTARLWEVASGNELAALHAHEGPILHSVFSPDGRLLATTSNDGTARLLELPSGSERATLDGHEGTVFHCAFSSDGLLLATAGDDGTSRIWEEVEPASRLPAVVPDAVGGADRLGIGKDAAALADVIAAKETSPPLSIGLFGDWGSGKSFLIGEVKERIRRIARRAQASESSAYCAYVRNVEFNAWHYADANLWASLVTHIFDELAKPEPTVGVSDDTAQAQVARLEEELAAQSGLRDQLVRAREHTRRAEARRRLLQLTWRLAGVEGADRSLGELREDLTSARGAAKLLLPNARARLALVATGVVVAGAVVVIASIAGADWLERVLGAVGAGLATALGWFEIGRRYAMRLLPTAGETVPVAEVKTTPADVEVEAAREAEHGLRRELADLRSGRRIARFAVERGATDDYRSHLGLVSRIHEDFERMSEILAGQRASGAGGDADSDLPQIDRIVLYIDDLDRCPPQRVVEVLEAVHLILAVPLFVVVIAVDPRWLVQSLRLHYSELLAGKTKDGAALGTPTDEAWRSTPIHYLEKIIQVPFALRRMGPRGVESLVHGLLPVEEGEPLQVSADGATPAVPSSSGDGAGPPAVTEAQPQPTSESAPPAGRAPSLSPRTLALTEAERNFAVNAAGVLRTPRTVKKFTNLYRLLRAGLDEYTGELDRFLAAEPDEAPEYQAVLILIAMIIAFPEEASDVLLGLSDFSPDAHPAALRWAEFVQNLRGRGRQFEEVARFLERVSPEDGAGWTTEPFRRWALEVSRYSFATGQEVFSSVA